MTNSWDFEKYKSFNITPKMDTFGKKVLYNERNSQPILPEIKQFINEILIKKLKYQKLLIYGQFLLITLKTA